MRSCLDAPVLDLYAGAGFLGIEALSHGAPGVDFVERDRTACDVIRRNLATLEISAGARVLCLSAERAIRRLQGPYGLCFVDPPYREDATAVAEAVVHMGLLAPTALVLWRHPRSRPAPEALGTLARRDTRRYGDAVLETYRLAVGDPSPGQDESAP